MMLRSLYSLWLVFFGTALSTEYCQYAVIVDAGSTGSRVHVYKYASSEDANELLDIDLANEKYKKITPGLSSFAELAPSKLKREVSEYIVPLLHFARKHIPENIWKSTPLFVLATAGMRKVRDNNEGSALRVMAAMCDAIAASEFLSSPNWVRIIEGQNEGLWAWVTANYLNGALQSSGKIKTTGVLEMGGKSLQITFRPAQTCGSEHESEHLTTALIVANDKYKVFTHSYMDFGMEATQLLFDKRLAKNQSLVKAKTPCYLTGTTRKFASFEFTGDGDFGLCFKELSLLIKERMKCAVDNTNAQRHDAGEQKDGVQQMSATRKCTPNGVWMPSIPESQQFYLIENFYYYGKALDIAHLRGEEFVEALKVKGEAFCKLMTEQAAAAFPHALDFQIPKMCFASAWLSAIIDIGFDLTVFFQVIRNINDVNIDWTLGFLVLNEVVVGLESMQSRVAVAEEEIGDATARGELSALRLKMQRVTLELSEKSEELSNAALNSNQLKWELSELGDSKKRGETESGATEDELRRERALLNDIRGELSVATELLQFVSQQLEELLEEKRSRESLAERFHPLEIESIVSFQFIPWSTRTLTQVTGVETTWNKVKERFHSAEFAGDGLDDASAKYFFTKGVGPKMFAVADDSVYYHDFGKWFPYRSSELIKTAHARVYYTRA